MMETFEKHQVSFVSVTQQFNSATSMGRLVLNVLLSFAQFERELVSERTRDKMAATRRKGKWTGGRPPLGYDVDPGTRKLVINDEEATQVRALFALYLEHHALLPVVLELHRRGWVNKRWQTRSGIDRGGEPFSKVSLQRLLTNIIYTGQVCYKGEVHPGEHPPLVDRALWLKAQALLKRRDRSWNGNGTRQPPALLAGRLWCQTCGAAMIATHSANRSGTCYRYYVCRAHRRDGRSVCAAKPVPAVPVEAFVVEQVRRIGRDAEWQQALLAALRRHEESQRREREAEYAKLAKEAARHQAALRSVARARAAA
jgi:site-specific DNA recombinase